MANKSNSQSKSHKQFSGKRKKSNFTKDRNSREFDKYSSRINDSSSKDNDASWYTKNQQLTADAGRIAFTWPIGSPLTMGPDDQFNVPGMMSFDVIPAIGWSQDATSVVNIAARNVYSFVRHANSGHANYDSTSLMMYFLAMDSLYSWYAYGARAYGSLALNSQRNRYYPRALVAAEGFDYNDLSVNIADFRYYLNQVALKIGSLCVPNKFSYYSRHIWMYSGLYSDSESAKAQVYMYRPYGYHVYNEASKPGKLEFKVPDYTGSEALLTFSEYRRVMEEMLNPIVNSEDMNIMSGDVLKAYGESNLIKLNQISEDYTVIPRYSDEVLEQIQNINVTFGEQNMSIVLSDMDIVDNPDLGAITFSPRIKFGSYDANKAPLYVAQTILAAHEESPEPERVLTMSRLACRGEVETDTGTNTSWYKLTHVGSEFVVQGRMWFYNNSREITSGVLLNRVNGTNMGAAVAGNVANLSTFAHHPCITHRIGGNVIRFFDVENFAIVSDHEIDKLNETSLMSMFDVPQLGTAFGSVMQK